MPFNKDLILIFSLDEYRFAIDVTSLVEVTDSLEISALDSFTGYVGNIDFHGKKTTLIDLREKLFIKGRGEKDTPALVVKVNFDYYAFQVDFVDSIVEEKSMKQFEFPQFILKTKGLFPHLYEWNGKYVAGIDTNMLFK